MNRTTEMCNTAMWSDEDEIGDNLASPVTNFKPIVTRTKRPPRLKRAQSERVTSIELPNYNPPNSPGGRIQNTAEISQTVEGKGTYHTTLVKF